MKIKQKPVADPGFVKKKRGGRVSKFVKRGGHEWMIKPKKGLILHNFAVKRGGGGGGWGPDRPIPGSANGNTNLLKHIPLMCNALWDCIHELSVGLRVCVFAEGKVR